MKEYQNSSWSILHSKYILFYVAKVNVRDLPVGTLGEESFNFEVAELNGDWDEEWDGVPDSSFGSHAVLTPINKWFKFACTPEAIKVIFSQLFHFSFLKKISFKNKSFCSWYTYIDVSGKPALLLWRKRPDSLFTWLVRWTKDVPCSGL